MRSAKSAGKTRAETVRQRRTQQTQPVAKQSLTALQYTPPVAPVFVRGGLSTPVVQRARSKVRRPVAIPLGSPGVELHLPSLPAFRPGWRLFSGMLTILLSTLLALVAFSSEYTTGTPQIHGIHRLSNADIQTVVDIDGKQAFMIDPRQIAWQLASAFPELRAISVSVKLPAVVIISAQERTPVTAWQSGEQTWWIDAENVVFPPRGDPGVPLLTISADTPPPLVSMETDDLAAVFSEKVSPQKLQAAKAENAFAAHQKIDAQLMQAIQTLGSQTPTDSGLVYSTRDGLGWVDPGGWKVYFGLSLEDLKLKLIMYNHIIEKLKAQGIQPSMVSIAHIHAPFYRGGY